MNSVLTPEPSLTRSASLNQNPGALSLFLFIFRVIKFSFSKMSRSESPARPKWRIRTRARFTPTFSFILSKHFIMSFRCGSGFSFGQAHNHLQIQCNSVQPQSFNKIHLQRRHSCLFRMIYKNQGSEFNPFVYKIPLVQKK